MKRSEMQSKIAEFLETLDGYSPVYKAQLLLDFLEEQGMLPPAHTDVNRGDHMDFYEINDWEKET